MASLLNLYCLGFQLIARLKYYYVHFLPDSDSRDLKNGHKHGRLTIEYSDLP